MSLIRTFLALPLPGDVRKYVYQFPHHILDTRDKINWVKRTNIHITLSYLGDTDPDLIEDQAKDINALVESYEPIQMATDDTGVYPHANDARVLWIGASPFSNALNSLRKDLHNILGRHGYRVDNRKFQPHITVGRVKTISRKSSFIHDYLVTDAREMEFTVNSVKWLKSTLTPDGPEYEEIKTFNFKQGE